jgi:hypothetical protein
LFERRGLLFANPRSFMKYVAKPVEVEAFPILEVGPALTLGRRLVLSTGEIVQADSGMLARYIPEPGDFWVTQSDGYQYVNPKAVFERKYWAV